MELEEALKHNIPIAPILIQGAKMPDKKDVPASLHPIWALNAPSIAEGRDLLNNIGYIMQGFERAIVQKGKHRKVENSASIQQFEQMPPIADEADLDTALDHFVDAVKANDYPQALVWISYIRSATNHIPSEFELDARERDIQERLRGQQEAKRRRDVCDYQYKFVRRMLKMGDPAYKIKAFVQKIWTNEDGYIPDDLEKQLRPIMGGGKIVTPTKPKIILPAPFDWCYIPEGDVILTTDAPDNNFYVKNNTVVRVPPFWMAKYPVTNAQFAEFIKAGGYKTDKWWTKAGIAHRNSDKLTQPRYWDDKKWNGADYPVVGISWYEAVACCNWLSEKTGDKIMLPTDAQWQRAAQGDDGRDYPWGNDWNGDLCNNSVEAHGSNQTTSVRHYEGKGDSPFGVVDMAGNVWEWCSTMYKTGDDSLEGTDGRMLRGGSWYYADTSGFRVPFRVWSNPQGSFGGFRFCSLL